MMDALIATKSANHLGAVERWNISLAGQPLRMDEVTSLTLIPGDVSSALITEDGSTRPVYAKRRFWRPKLLLSGQLYLRRPGDQDPLTLDVGDVLYMTLKKI